MLVVKIELHSANTGKITEIGRMWIANRGGTYTRGNYWAKTLRGRNKIAFDKHKLSNHKANRMGYVSNYPRTRLHIWNLVARCLNTMEYK